jgi:hypothetical protein
MRSAERELMEIERKKQAADNQAIVLGSKPVSGSTDAMRQRVMDITKHIAEESKRLAATRAQLQRLKQGEITVEKAKPSHQTSMVHNLVDEVVAESTEKKASSTGRIPTNPVPEELYPELCK